jgi:hypothetical protein
MHQSIGHKSQNRAPYPGIKASQAWRWKESVHDALYLIAFVPIPSTALTPGKYVGGWTIVDGTHANRWLSFQAGYVHAAAGEAVQSAVDAVERLLAEHDLASIHERIAPVLRYAAKLTRDPQAVRQSDAEAILSAGWGRNRPL